jgi:FixJ family two-component response regulator
MAQPILTPAVPSEQESARRTAHNIVVVEDDTSMRAAIERVLGTAGFPVRSFATAAELGNDVASSAACLILDIHLPDRSGLDLRRQLLRDGIHPPVIFITAFDGPDARAQAGQLGAAGFLSKPFGGRQLLDAVSNAIRPN